THDVFSKNVKTPLLLEVKVGFVYGLRLANRCQPFVTSNDDWNRFHFCDKAGSQVENTHQM
uniref:hypothetical protein n=1 Tax=Bacillus pumilus TaxID=1408 RepID=UPI001C92EBD5